MPNTPQIIRSARSPPSCSGEVLTCQPRFRCSNSRERSNVRPIGSRGLDICFGNTLWRVCPRRVRLMQIVRIGDQTTEQASAGIVGAKAANLAHMARLGLSVPPAFVLPVGLCAAIIAGEPRAEQDLRDGLCEGIAFLEERTGQRFG